MLKVIAFLITKSYHVTMINDNSKGAESFMTTSNTIRKLRGNKSQREFAEENNISQPYLCQLEKGQKKPSRELIKLLVDKYKISPMELME